VSKGKILIIDDEAGIRRTLSSILEDDGYTVETAGTGEDGLESVREGSPEVLLLDVLLPGITGLEVLDRVLKPTAGQRPQVVMISGHSTTEMVVDAIKAGAFDFIEKPLSLEKTLLIVKNALRQQRLEEKNRLLREAYLKTPEIIGGSGAMLRLKDLIAQVAPTNGRVLIFGEHGTGKELVARQIHLLSQRADEPFVEVNCAAIPEELIESEMFGHTKGAFTGATEPQRGKFTLADRGTLFLDEVGDMSLKTQAKLLRALEEQRITPVGSGKTQDVDVRIITATNKDLEAEIQRGNFREDLFFRLNVVPFFIPPLRERAEDIPAMVRHFLEQYGSGYGRAALEMSGEALAALERYRWPGNVRELRNIVERLVIMVSSDRIRLEDLPAAIRGGSPSSLASFGPHGELLSLKEARGRFERDYILRVLGRCEGNVSRAAESLGMERSTFYRKMKSFGVDPKDIQKLQR